MPKKNSNSDPSFEQLYTELEATIETLEGGNLALDEALALFERGMELARQCTRMLDRADLRIKEIAPAAEEFSAEQDAGETIDLDQDE
jgi:exodeoxyribonuclease VII small subunit